jgi:glutamyl-tRNA synthetase
MSVRVRYAPSPTGFQHIAGARTALYDYLFAKSQGGKFILRIEDTDRKRLVPEALQDIYDTFSWLGFYWDEGPDVGGSFGPYCQSERLDHYQKHAEDLVAKGCAYRCYCSEERLEKLRQDQQATTGSEESADKSTFGYDRHCRNLGDAERRAAESSGAKSVIRLKVPSEGSTTYNDVILGEITVENKTLSPDPVLIKSDGFPTYHMAVVVDDHLMEITHVMRGQEWLPSVPIYIILYAALGWKPPIYCHLPLVMGKDGHKLSKRLGSTSVREFREKGYLPEALLNCIVLVGWSYDDSRELFSLADLEKLFDINKLSKSPGVFDFQKLDWFNGMYIRAKTPAELARLITPVLAKAGIDVSSVSAASLEGIAGLVRERIKTLAEAPAMVRYLFEEPAAPQAEDLVPKKTEPGKAVEALKAALESLSKISGSEEENEKLFRGLAETLGMKLGDLLMPVRVAVTGSKVSPPLFESIRILGPEKTRARVQRAVDILAESASRSR